MHSRTCNPPLAYIRPYVCLKREPYAPLSCEQFAEFQSPPSNAIKVSKCVSRWLQKAPLLCGIQSQLVENSSSRVLWHNFYGVPDGSEEDSSKLQKPGYYCTAVFSAHMDSQNTFITAGVCFLGMWFSAERFSHFSVFKKRITCFVWIRLSIVEVRKYDVGGHAEFEWNLLVVPSRGILSIFTERRMNWTVKV